MKRKAKELIVLRERLESFELKLKNANTPEAARQYKDDIKRLNTAIRRLEGRP